MHWEDGGFRSRVEVRKIEFLYFSKETFAPPIPGHLNGALFLSFSDLALFQKLPMVFRLRASGVCAHPPSIALLHFYLHVCLSIS